MSFFDLDGIHTGFIAENRPRALAAGVDPYEYDRVTAGIEHIREWPDAFIAAASARVSQARDGSAATRAEADRAAALLFHFATVLPDADEERRAGAAAAAAAALARALPAAVAVVDEHVEEGFRGFLQFPNGFIHQSNDSRTVVILVPGMNSSAVEFAGVAETLLRRGLAVLSIDGPGQGACPGRWQPEFERVVGRAIDAVPDATSIGVWGMSMGGWLAARATAYEPRVRALVAVSGPGELRWPELVPYVTDTFRHRCGGEEAGKTFAASVDGAELTRSTRVVQTLVVEGGKDAIPGVGNLEVLGQGAARGVLTIPDGGHLVEEHRHMWLPWAADWMAGRLGRA